jgi:hypothetical protein
VGPLPVGGLESPGSPEGHEAHGHHQCAPCHGRTCRSRAPEAGASGLAYNQQPGPHSGPESPKVQRKSPVPPKGYEGGPVEALAFEILGVFWVRLHGSRHRRVDDGRARSSFISYRIEISSLMPRRRPTLAPGDGPPQAPDWNSPPFIEPDRAAAYRDAQREVHRESSLGAAAHKQGPHDHHAHEADSTLPAGAPGFQPSSRLCRGCHPPLLVEPSGGAPCQRCLMCTYVPWQINTYPHLDLNQWSAI